jgi:phenylacetate-coenzyme A ligase PaaK-like adenylate-forming protein
VAGASVYARVPVAVQHLLTATYGLRMRRIRYGRVFAETRRWLAVTEGSSRAEVEQLQSQALQRTVNHAVARTAYYRDLFGELRLTADMIRTPRDLLRIPVIDKETVLARADELRAEGVATVRTYFTSGTSGTTLAVPIDDSSRQRNYAFFARALAWAGVENGRSATFAGRPIVPGTWSRPGTVWRWNPAMRNRLFSSYHLSPANAAAYSRALCRYAPDYIDSYPSSVALLASLLSEARLRAPRPKAIITSAETLTTRQRELIEEVFGARCYDQYGCTEQSVFASQCEHATYHVHPEYGIVEILRENGDPAQPGETGEIVCTSFTNDAFPLLRYRLGDVAVLGEGRCPCGREFPTLDRILGRLDDVLVTPDGRRVGRLDPAFKGRRTIREAQVVQESEAKVTVRIVPGSDYRDEDGLAVVKELEARLGSEMEIVVERVPSIKRTGRGKLRAVVNRSRHAMDIELRTGR